MDPHELMSLLLEEYNYIEGTQELIPPWTRSQLWTLSVERKGVLGKTFVKMSHPRPTEPNNFPPMLDPVVYDNHQYDLRHMYHVNLQGDSYNELGRMLVDLRTQKVISLQIIIAKHAEHGTCYPLWIIFGTTKDTYYVQTYPVAPVEFFAELFEDPTRIFLTFQAAHVVLALQSIGIFPIGLINVNFMGEYLERRRMYLVANSEELNRFVGGVALKEAKDFREYHFHTLTSQANMWDDHMEAAYHGYAWMSQHAFEEWYNFFSFNENWRQEAAQVAAYHIKALITSDYFSPLGGPLQHCFRVDLARYNNPRHFRTDPLALVVSHKYYVWRIRNVISAINDLQPGSLLTLQELWDVDFSRLAEEASHEWKTRGFWEMIVQSYSHNWLLYSDYMVCPRCRQLGHLESFCAIPPAADPLVESDEPEGSRSSKNGLKITMIAVIAIGSVWLISKIIT